MSPNATLIASLKIVKKLEIDLPLVETPSEVGSPDGEVYSLFDKMQAEGSLFDEFARREGEERLRAAVMKLVPRSRLVIIAVWGLFGYPKLSYENIGRALHVNKQRVQQIENEAKVLLKGIMEGRLRDTGYGSAACPKRGEALRRRRGDCPRDRRGPVDVERAASEAGRAAEGRHASCDDLSETG